MSRGNILLRWSVVLAAMLLGAFLSLNISINDNALDLLPDGAVKGDLQILQQLGLIDRLFITLSVDEDEYPTKGAAKEALKKSVESIDMLLKGNELFSFVTARLPEGYEGRLFKSLQDYLPLLFDEKDLVAVEHLTSAAGLEKVMQKNFELLNSPAGIGMKKQIQSDPLGLTGLLLKKLVHLQTEFSMHLEDGFFMSDDGKSCLVLAESKLSLTDSKGAQTIEKELENVFTSGLMAGVEARIIGSLPHTLANSRSIQRDLRLLLPVATVLLLLLLALTLKDIRALIVLSVPFMAGLPATAVTSLVFGDISALALGFGIVLLGIAVDFSVHLYLTLSRGKGTQRILLRRVQKPIIFATLTTTAVLLILLFSEVASHRQMATLAITGILLAVFFAWLVIPTIVSEQQRRAKSIEPEKNPETRFLSPPLRKAILGVWVILLAAGLLAWPQLKYNGDLRVLDVPDRQVLADEHFFDVTWGKKGDQAFVISFGESLEDALENNSLIYRFLRENKFAPFQSLAPILPGPGFQENNRKQWHRFWTSRSPVFEHEFSAVAQANGFSEQAFDPFFRRLEHNPGLLLAEELYNSPLRGMLATMVRSYSAVGGNDGETQFLVMNTVTIDDTTLPVLLAFAEKKPEITVLANRKWRAEVEQLLRKDIIILCLAAGCAVLFLVVLQFRKIDVTAAVLAPVLSALAAMSVFCWVTGGELNMMHLIMGIMVIGLSVDYGIFIACSRATGDSGTALLAVSVCAVSSLIGFGVLAFAHHPALHSLGITVLVGIGAAWPAALTVSPSLIKKQSRVVQ